MINDEMIFRFFRSQLILLKMGKINILHKKLLFISWNFQIALIRCNFKFIVCQYILQSSSIEEYDNIFIHSSLRRIFPHKLLPH